MILGDFFEIKAQSYSEKIVNQFGDLMTSWCKTGDDDYRIEIDELVSGSKGCRVDDGIMRIFVKRDNSELLSKGSVIVDNYLNCFTNSIENGLSYEHGKPFLHVEMKEPTAFSEKEEAPLHFVTMDVNVSGDFWFEGTNLFFVRGDQITKIEDFKDENSLSRAIGLYSLGKYDEAFKLFRKLAYQHPDNYEAQYYTAIMEIKKQGCKELSGKVRDMEAAWWIVRGTVGQSPSWIKDRMSKLYNRFSINEKVLPFNTFGKSIYLNSLETRQLISEGLMCYKKDRKYGYMDESGKVVIPCVYDVACPFDKLGHALVGKKGKFGYINRRGEVIIPIIYDSAIESFQNGKTMVVKDGELQILSETGEVLTRVGDGFDSLLARIFKDCVYAFHKESNTYYVVAFSGDIKSKQKNGYKVDALNHCYFIEDADGNKISTDTYGWDNEK